MPNHKTFDIKPIRSVIDKYLTGVSIDPFANQSRLAKFNNDLDPQYGCEFNLDAIEFLKSFQNESVDVVLFDPPYSPRQISECYKALGLTVNMQTTQSSFWANMKNEISRIVKPSGIVITFGWNSGGIGKKNGFDIIEILMVAHGGWHNDTIVTVDKKVIL
jgi:hypothetical protein